MLRLSSARVEARSLVRELSLHMAHGQKKKYWFCFKILNNQRKVEK